MSKPKFAGFEKSQNRRQSKKLQIPPHNTSGIKRHRKFRGMRRTYRTPQLRGMQRNAEVGLFTKPSTL
jgi:hypothetical protein